MLAKRRQVNAFIAPISLLNIANIHTLIFLSYVDFLCLCLGIQGVIWVLLANVCYIVRDSTVNRPCLIYVFCFIVIQTIHIHTYESTLKSNVHPLLY